jgi:hypothetical protein
MRYRLFVDNELRLALRRRAGHFVAAIPTGLVGEFGGLVRWVPLELSQGLHFRHLQMTMTCMWRITSKLIAVLMFLLATGVPAYLHHLQHEYEDACEARQAAAASGSTSSSTPAHGPSTPVHDESTCSLCAQFHAPLLAGSWSIELIDTGQCVQIISLHAIRQSSQTAPSRISCRGPPSISSC